MDNLKHECPVDGCTVQVPNELLMCAPHWRLVPKHEQREVWSTWSRVHRDRQAYVDARDAAIASANKAASRGQGRLL